MAKHGVYTGVNQMREPVSSQRRPSHRAQFERYLVCAALVGLVSVSGTLVAAQPDIGAVNNDDPLVNRQEFIVDGSAFGTKVPAAPLLWDDFERGADRELVSYAGGWIVEGDNDAAFLPQYRDERSHSGDLSICDIKPPESFGTYQRDIARQAGLDLNQSDKFIWSVWINHTWGGPDTDGSGSRQHKFMRLTDGPGQTDTKPELVLSWNRNGFHLLATDENGNWNFCDGQTLYMSHPDSSVWHNMAVVGQLSSGSSNCDGQLHPYYDFRLQADIDDWAWFSGTTDNIDEVWLGGYSSGNEAFQFFYFDDVYVDDTWARVEIGNAANYDDCTQREFQIPTGWSETGISCVANRGSFLVGEPLYLFVVDEDGNVSDGVPVAFTADGDPTAGPGIPGGASLGPQN